MPLDQAHVFAIGSPEIPAIRAELDLKGRRVTIVGVHAVPPKGATMAQLRNHQLAQISAMVSNGSLATLLLGDLNVTPWSAQFHRLQESSPLQRCSLGRGVQPTWPADIPIFLIPIDHCLHADGITILNNEIGSSVGSDHYPVIVDFVPTSE
jgi:endonuclease/exonuclease/phosphatase (EEP) superfamily protein YafD